MKPAKGAEEDDWGKPVGLNISVCGYAKVYADPFPVVNDADLTGIELDMAFDAMCAVGIVAASRAKCSIKSLQDLPEKWWVLTESDTGGYQYQTEVKILDAPVRVLLDGCAGVNSIPEEVVIGAVNRARHQGMLASDPITLLCS